MHGRGTRSPAEKEVRDNSRTGGPAPPPRAVRGACPTAKDLLDLHVHRLQGGKKQPAGPTAKQSNSKLDGCTAAFLDFEQQKNAPWLPQKGPTCGSRRRGRRGELNPVFFIFDPKTQKPPGLSEDGGPVPRRGRRCLWFTPEFCEQICRQQQKLAGNRRRRHPKHRPRIQAPKRRPQSSGSAQRNPTPT